MKSITFRPLRLVKKTGKIVAASYAQWNKVRAADYSEFLLTVSNEYASLPADAYVYNSAGKPLFWLDVDPASIPVYDWSPLWEADETLAKIHAAHPLGGYAIRWRGEGRICYSCSWLGLDCDGTPAFSNYTLDDVVYHRKDFAQWEPLTVGVVVKWVGWFLYQLENSSLQIGR